MTLRFVVLVVAAVVASSSPAHAIDRNCPKGQTWSITQGTCVKKKPAPRLSPQDKYDRANDHLEGKGKAPDARRGIRMLEENCAANHAASCNLLGFLYARGRNGLTLDDDRAKQLFVKSCQLDELEGCFNIGDLAYRTGKYGDAQTAFRRACELGSGVGCARGADLIDRGIGGKASPTEAAPLFKRGHELLAPRCPEDSTACFVLGFLFEHGKGVAMDPSRSLDYFRKGCDGSHGGACVALANGLDRGAAGRKDVEGADRAYEKACARFDNGEACQKIAERLGIAKRNLPRALELARRGCELDPKNCGTLGEFERLGLGAARDQVAATGHYKAACEAGSGTWCETYGKRAHAGIGGRADKPAAIQALERGCQGGFPSACSLAAQYLADGKTDDKRAATLAATGCDAKHAHACYLAGWLTMRGRGGPRSVERAFERFEQGCTLGSPFACDGAGNAYRDGEGAAADATKAVERFELGCKGNDTDVSAAACTSLGKIRFWGQGVAKDPKAALAAFTRACQRGEDACRFLGPITTELGDPLEPVIELLRQGCKDRVGGHEYACLAYGNQLALSTREADRRQAYETFTASCGRRSDDACLRQADLLTEGWGVAADPQQAEQLYRKRCDAGRMGACFGLGRLLDKQTRREDALRLYRQACDGSWADACSAAGFSYYTAHGTRWNVAEAATLFIKACELGSNTGCANAADVYRYGAGAKQDHAKAFAHYEKSCLPLDPTGCSGLGHYLATGEGGIEIDHARAEGSLRAACTHASYVMPEACHSLANLLERRKHGTPAEIARLRTTAFARAQELAADNPYYMFVLGTYYATGMATVTDPAAAIEWLGKACDGFDPLGCIAAGKALRATGTPANADRARVYFERACAAGMDDGCALGQAKAPAPPPVAAKPRGCGCAGEVAPGAHGGLALLLGVALARRRRRA